MALVRIPERQHTIDDHEAVASFLAKYGITYERWEAKRNVPADATAEAVLQAYSDKVEELKARYPLREARVDVSEIPGKPGNFRAVTFLRPHFQLNELTISLRLVAELPPPAA